MATRPPFTRFGRYLLLHRLAVGGMAEVFLAIDPRAPADQQLVVIKQIREDLSSNREFVDMFIDEVRVIDRLDHPSIVRMQEYGVVDGRSFIALEHVWGESLSTLTRICADQDTRFPISAALHIASEVASALDHAHTHRDRAGRPSPVIHRDVTLGNVVVSYQGEVKILDFGIAKAAGRVAETRAGHVKGTLGYLAPEQIRGEPVGPHTDIYQLGVMLYHLVVGRPPLSEANDLKLMKAIVNGQITPPRELNPNLPPAVEQLLLRTLALQPADRFRSAGALAELLRQMIAPVLHEARPRLASLMRRITGDRYQRQQAFIRSLIAGGQEIEAGSSSLFEWAFNEAGLDTSSRELSVETDHASLDSEATQVVPRPELDEPSQARFQLEPPDTMIDGPELGHATVVARSRSSEFRPGRLVDESTDDSLLLPRPVSPVHSAPAAADAMDVHDVQTVLELPPEDARVPRPVSGVFRSLTEGTQLDDARREAGSSARDLPGRRRDQDLADALLSGHVPPAPLLPDVGLTDAARALAIELEQALGREEPVRAEDDLAESIRASLADPTAARGTAPADPIHDQITSPGHQADEATLLVRERHAAARGFQARRSGPVAIEDAQTRLLSLAEEEAAGPARRPTDPGALQPGVWATRDPVSTASAAPPPREVVTAQLEAAEDAEAGPVAHAAAEPRHRATTAPSQRRVHAVPFEAPAGVEDWHTEGSIAVGRFQNRGARLAAGGLLVALLALVVGAFLINPSNLQFLRRATARLTGSLDAASAVANPVGEGDAAVVAGGVDGARRDSAGPRVRDAGRAPRTGGAAARADAGAPPSPPAAADRGRPVPPRVVREPVEDEDTDEPPPPPPGVGRILGRLQIEAPDAAQIRYPGSSGTGSAELALRTPQGTVQVQLDDVAIELRYEVVEDQIKFHVHSAPPLALEYNGLQVGRTPKALMLGKRFRVQLGASTRAEPIVLQLRYGPP